MRSPEAIEACRHLGVSRVQMTALPSGPAPCPLLAHCVYRDADWMCDSPQTNKGNGDARCHSVSNAQMWLWFNPVKQ